MAFFHSNAISIKRFYPFYRYFQKSTEKTSDFFKFTLSQANGINIISKDLGGPATSLSIVIRSGSRYEPSPGLAHLLQRFAFKNTERRSSLRIVREIELLGANLFSTLSRETITLSAKFLRNDLAYFVNLLAEVLMKTRYNAHELDETVLPYALSENKRRYINPTTLGLDTLHELAFRRGLGSPVLTNERNNVTVEMIKNYAKKMYVKNNLVILAKNANQLELVELVKEHFNDLPLGAIVPSPQTNYYGGENRIGFKSHVGHFLISFPRSAAFASHSEEYLVLSYLLGMGSRVKWSYENSPFGAIEKSLSNGTTLLSNNFAYSDAGLFCIHIFGPVETLKDAVKSSIQALKSMTKNIRDEDLKRAISQAKYSLLDIDSQEMKIYEDLGVYYLSSGSLLDYTSIISRIEKVSSAKIKSTISKMLETKPSVIAIGDTNLLPYYDEL